MRNGNYGTRYTEGIRNKTAISKEKWSPLTFGLDSVQFRPNLSMKNRIYKKKPAPLTRARIFCGVYKVFENRKKVYHVKKKV